MKPDNGTVFSVGHGADALIDPPIGETHELRKKESLPVRAVAVTCMAPEIKIKPMRPGVF